MAVKAGEIERGAREIINDTYASGYRWAPPTVLRFVYEAVQRLNSIRPESRYAGLTLAILVVPPITDDMDGEDIEEVRAADIVIDARWEVALMHYVAHRCYSLDDPDSQDANKSAAHKAEFERMAQT